jgi:hypothetical protein
MKHLLIIEKCVYLCITTTNLTDINYGNIAGAKPQVKWMCRDLSMQTRYS